MLSFNSFLTVLIFLLQDENQSCRRGGNTSTWDSGIGGLSSISNMASQFEGELAASVFYSKLRDFWINSRGDKSLLHTHTQ